MLAAQSCRAARSMARRPIEPIPWETLRAGIRFVWIHKPILATITLDLFAVLFGGVTYLFPDLCRGIIARRPPGLGVGFLLSADAAGSIVMAVMLAHLPPIRRAGRTMLGPWPLLGRPRSSSAYRTWFWLSMAMMFLVGVMDSISVVVRHTLVQMLTPDAHARTRLGRQ